MFREAKKTSRHFFRSAYFFSFLGLLILSLIGWPLYKNVNKQYRINKEIGALKNDIAKIENENKGLEELITYLKSDHFTEEQARLNLNLCKENEEVAVIKQDGQSQDVTNKKNQNTQKDNIAVKENNFQRWVKYFFSK